MTLIALFLLVASACGLVCPELITCYYNTDREVCAELTSSTISINNYACEEHNYMCSFNEFTEFYKTQSLPATVKCKEQSLPYSDLTGVAADICTNKESYMKKKLQYEHLHMCSSDEECTLGDGTHGKCGCTAMRGLAFCDLNFGDDLLKDIYDIACEGDTTKLRYYLAYKEAFFALIFRVDCYENLLEYAYYKNSLVKLTSDLPEGSVLVLAVLWYLML